MTKGKPYNTRFDPQYFLYFFDLTYCTHSFVNIRKECEIHLRMEINQSPKNKNRLILAKQLDFINHLYQRSNYGVVLIRVETTN